MQGAVLIRHESKNVAFCRFYCYNSYMHHPNKRILLIFILIFISVSFVFAQRVPSVGVVTFEASGSGASPTDAFNLTAKIISEFNSWGTLNVIQGTAGAEYIIKGSLSRLGNDFTLTATTADASGRVLNEYSEKAQNVNNISIPSFCAKAVERVPLPNYLLGTWQSTLNMPDGPVVCIIEFKSDRKTVIVERYDTWEHKQQNALRYEGFGTGTYSYRGYANRVINAGGRQARIDAVVGINLTLEETLPAQTSVNLSNLNLEFNAEKTSFVIVSNMMPCGRNFDGPSVYHSEVLGFSQFVKIR